MDFGGERLNKAKNEKQEYDEKVQNIKKINMLNQKKEANIDSRLKYLRQKIMTYMQSGEPYSYQTGIGIEIDKLNNALENKLNEKTENLRFEIERNLDTQSVTSVKTTIDL